jgi:hypothetical protein
MALGFDRAGPEIYGFNPRGDGCPRQMEPKQLNRAATMAGIRLFIFETANPP